MPNLPLCHWSSQLFDLRAPSSTDVPFLLLNQAIIGSTPTVPPSSLSVSIGSDFCCSSSFFSGVASFSSFLTGSCSPFLLSTISVTGVETREEVLLEGFSVEGSSSGQASHPFI